MLIYNEDDQLIYTNEASLYEENLPIASLLDVTSNEISINDIDYIKDTRKADYKQWSYISLVPKDIYYDRINQVSSIVTLMVIVFSLINVIIAYSFANWMYLPVKRIITSYRSDEDEAVPNQSEYEYIESVINKNIEEKGKMKRDLYLQKQPLKNAFFLNYLRGYTKDLQYIEKQLEHFNILISEDGYQVLLVEFMKHKEERSNDSLSQFIIHNIFEEIITTYFSCEAVELEDSVAFIINQDHSGILIEELEKHLNTAVDMVEKEYNLSCLLGVSRIHTSLIRLSNAYQESLESVNHAKLYKNRRIVYFEDIQKLSTQYEFSIEHENRLIHFIKIGDLTQTLAIIDEVIRQNTQEHLLKLGYMQCLMFDLIGAIIKSVNDEAFNHLINDKSPIRRMMATSDMEEMKGILVEVATIACELQASQYQQTKKYAVNDDINAFIEENYADPDLNVARLGDVFNMTPAYLSKLYKNETGNSILHAINMTRIEASKKLLVQTNYSISEISEKVGYLYSNAFIRFFKNHTGITPGQYKNMTKSTS